MLPHDELLHYGVRGMRWGIRKAAAGAYEKGARREQGYADKKRNIANKARSKGGLVNKGIAKVYDKGAKTHQTAANKQRKIAQSLSKPLPKKTKRYLTNFDKIAFGSTAFVVGGVAMKLVGPTADNFGQSIAKYVGRKVVKKTNPFDVSGF